MAPVRGRDELVPSPLVGDTHTCLGIGHESGVVNSRPGGNSNAAQLAPPSLEK